MFGLFSINFLRQFTRLLNKIENRVSMSSPLTENSLALVQPYLD